MFQNTKFIQCLVQRQGHVHTKTLQTFCKNNYTKEEINYKQTFQRLFLCSSIK